MGMVLLRGNVRMGFEMYSTGVRVSFSWLASWACFMLLACAWVCFATMIPEHVSYAAVVVLG
jgi:hypothetical protein